MVLRMMKLIGLNHTWFDLIWFSILSKNTDIAHIKNTIVLKIAIITHTVKQIKITCQG